MQQFQELTERVAQLERQTATPMDAGPSQMEQEQEKYEAAMRSFDASPDEPTMTK